MRRIATLAVLLLAALPSTALGSPSQIFEDCQDGRLDRRHADADLREALKRMPVDLDEYSNCRELIRSAQQGTRAGGSGEGSTFNDAGGYGALPAGEGGLPLGPDSRPIDPVGIATPEERREVEEARTGKGLDVPGRADAAVPANAGTRPGKASGAALPEPLIALLVLTGAGILAGAGPRLTRLVLRRPS